jgi:hypothetical protein
MPSLKIQSNFAKICATFLLLLFATQKSASFLHGFCHQENSGSEIIEENKNFFTQLIFSHEKSQKNSVETCLWQSFGLQNAFDFVAIFCAIFSAFLTLFFTRCFNRAKASYLLSSYFSQAPPAIS